jgi:AsmA family protein
VKQKIAKIILALIVMLAALVIIAIIYVKSSYFREDASHYLSQKTGRAVHLDGKIHIELRGEPRIIIHNITVGNPSWAKDPLMFNADRVEFTLRLAPLLKLSVVMPELMLDRPQIFLEKNAQQQANWIFSAESTAPVNDDAASSLPTIGHLQINDGTVTYRDAIRKIDTTMHVETMQKNEAESAIHVAGKGTYQNQPFSLDLTGASILQLRERTIPYPFTLKTSIGKTHAYLQGTVEDPVNLTALDVTMNVEGANAADIFPITGIALPPTPPYKLKGHLTRKADYWEFNKFSGKMGSSDLKGDLAWYPEQKPPYFKGDFTSTNLDMKDLAGFIGADEKPTDPNRVIPDKPLDISRLIAMNADATFSSKHIKTPNILDNVSMKISLKNGTLTLKPLSFNIANGKINANITIEGLKNPPITTASVTFQRLSLARMFAGLAKRFGEENTSAGLLGGKIALRGTGKSLHDMLATSKGTVGFGMEGGLLSKLLLELVGLDIHKVTQLLITGDKPTPINCMISDFDVNAGLMQARTFIMDTEVSTIEGQGTVNLKNEGLNLRLTVDPKKVSLFSARTPILIRGILKKPAISLESASLMKRGGAAALLGALLTPPGALLAFIDPGLGEGSNCAEYVRRFQKNNNATSKSTKR